MGQLVVLLLLIICFVIGINSLQTQKGVIYGIETQYSIEYLGIQYAKVNRWKPPIDLSTEMFPNSSYQATSFGPCCPQLAAGIYIPKQNEECLYLNIYTPKLKSNQSLYPVLVWIHGGGLQTGCSSQSIPLLYNGTNIISNLIQQQQEPVIIVTINYRLGILGDMYLNELIDENRSQWPTAGNYFYLDMLSSLRWINKNIIDYGGNPNNVLLFGESSGGNAVIDIGALKGSTNLYQHVISQSGGAGNYLYYTNMSNALQFSNEIIKKMNCSNENKQKILSCLRNSSVENLIEAYGYRQTQPIIDNYFFPYYPPLAIKNNFYNKNLNLILGNNDYEHPFCFEQPDMNSTDVMMILKTALGDKWSPKVANDFQLNTCSSNRLAFNRCCNMLRLVIMYKSFDCNVQRIYKNLISKYGQQNNLFWYHFDCNPGICPQLSIEEGGGICVHTAEIPYVFGTISSYNSYNNLNCTWDSQSRIFSNQIILHWTSIARRGKPLEQWLAYNSSVLKYFYIKPYENFSSVIWNGSCEIFDQMEDEYISLMFEHGYSLYYRNTNIISYVIILYYIFKID